MSLVTLLVRDYDQALDFYVGKLGFQLLEDSGGPDPDRRWVRIAPPGAPPGATALLLARAKNAGEAAQVGQQAGGRVAFFLSTDDFHRDHQAWQKAGVEFLEEPRHEPYGTVAVFQDVFGNRWDLIQPPS